MYAAAYTEAELMDQHDTSNQVLAERIIFMNEKMQNMDLKIQQLQRVNNNNLRAGMAILGSIVLGLLGVVWASINKSGS